MPHERPQRVRRVSGPQTVNAFAQIQADMRALNSSVLLLSQKMQYLVRNEKILGRNLIVLSKRLKEIEASGPSGGNGTLPPGFSLQMEEIAKKLDGHGQKLLELQNAFEDYKERSASKEQLSELKYVIDAINPLEFVTQKQLQESLKKGVAKKTK